MSGVGAASGDISVTIWLYVQREPGGSWIGESLGQKWFSGVVAGQTVEFGIHDGPGEGWSPPAEGYGEMQAMVEFDVRLFPFYW